MVTTPKEKAIEELIQLMIDQGIMKEEVQVNETACLPAFVFKNGAH